MKKLSLPLLLILFLVGCQKQMIKEDAAKEKTPAGKPSAKINLCHHDPVTGAYSILNLNINAWPEHQAHGDVRLDDQDGDGYVPTNSCGFGKMGDLNDLVATIYPGAPDICDNGIDDNGNGMVDEDCTVNICGVEWERRNFEGTTYRNGDAIPQVTDAAQWTSLTTGAWCYYNNDPALGAIYGKLYNHYALVDPRGIAPSGWHVPDYNIATALKVCAGGLGGPEGFYAGGNLKESGTAHWLSPNLEGRDSTGFTGLPGGFRHANGAFVELNARGAFWITGTYSPSPFQDPVYMDFELEYWTGRIREISGLGQEYGASLRLIKD